MSLYYLLIYRILIFWGPYTT